MLKLECDILTLNSKICVFFGVRLFVCARSGCLRSPRGCAGRGPSSLEAKRLRAPRELDKSHSQLLQHLDLALHGGGAVGVVAEAVDELLRVRAVLLLRLVLALLVLVLFRLCFMELFVISPARKQ